MSKFRVRQDGGHVVLTVRKGGADKEVDKMTPAQAAFLARDLAEKGKAAHAWQTSVLGTTDKRKGTDDETGLADN